MEREGNLKLECRSCVHCRGANIVILNWQRPLWKGTKEPVKRSGRDEPMWAVIYMCMEAMLGISLYSYAFLKLAKMLCLSYCCLCFLFNKIREQEGRTGSVQKWGGGLQGLGEGWMGRGGQTMYTHVSKCKNDKFIYIYIIKRKKKVWSHLG
jgi:hypothetical protein